MNNELLFNDNNQTIIHNFQYLVNNMFNQKISEYIHIKVLPFDSIYFIYKGGTSMKIQFEKYKKSLSNNEHLFNDLNKFFERSDADYSILINRQYFDTADSYNQIVNDMNKISYYVLYNIQNIISLDTDCFCPIDSVSEKHDVLENILTELNIKLEELKNDRKIPELSVINRFVGVTFNNNSRFREDYIKGHGVHYFDSGNALQTEIRIKEEGSITLKNNGYLSQERQNFIVKTVQNKTTGIYSPGMCYLDTDKNKNGIYYYFNETNKFSQNGELTEFNLHRLKINTVVYYITYDNKYGYFNCPSELVDVSIPNFNDCISKDLVFSEIIKKYNYPDFAFYSYSILGFIYDLLKGLFTLTKYPWDTTKYEKKVNRLMIFILIYINKTFGEESNRICDDLQGNIFYLLLDRKQKNINFNEITFTKDGKKKSIIEDPIMYKFCGYLSKIHENILKFGDEISEDKKLEFFKFLSI